MEKEPLSIYTTNKKITKRDKEESLKLYKNQLPDLKKELQRDSTSFLCPILCNNEMNFYLPKRADYVMYLSDRYFVKMNTATKEVIVKHELPPELFPNQIKSITFNRKKDKMLILTTRKRAAYLDIFVYDINNGKFQKIFLYEGGKKSLSLSKNQGFADEFIYQSKLMGQTVLKMHNLRSKTSRSLFCLDPSKESLRTFIPCMIEKLGLVFVMSFNSQEQHFKMNVYNYSRRKLVVSFRVDHQINWFISQHNKLTIMHFDQFTVVFSVNVLLFFIDLKHKTCKVLRYENRPFAGMVKKAREDEQPPVLENLEIIEYDGFFIAVANENFVFTYKNQLRRLEDGSIVYISTSNVVSMKNGVRISVRSCNAPEPLLEYYCLGVNPYEFETVKLGTHDELVSIKHREYSNNLVLELFKFDIESRQRYCWRKNLGRCRGTKYNFLTFSRPNATKIVIFYIVSGISLNYRIFDCLNNTLTESQKLVDDSGPMDILKLDDELNFVFNFRFTGIITGNFLSPQTFKVIPNTDHVFRTTMTQYGGDQVFFHLVDDFWRTRLEKVDLRQSPPRKEILFPDDRDFESLKHFSNGMVLSSRDDILFFYDCQTRVKMSFRVPEITKICKILHYGRKGETINVSFTDETFNNVFDLEIRNASIISVKRDKVKYNSDRCFIYTNGQKIYQVSDDHFYNMETGQFLNPDYKRILLGLFDHDTNNLEEFEDILEEIAHLGYKFSKYFGKNTPFQRIFELFGDQDLLDMYRINYDARSN